MADSYTVHKVYNAVKRIADKKVYWTYVEKYACKIWLRSAPNNIQGSMDVEVRWYESLSKLAHLKELGYIFRDNNGIESYCKSVFVGDVEDIEIIVREIAMIFEEIFDIPLEDISICETWEAHRTYFEDRGMLYTLAPSANGKTKLYLDIDGVLLTTRNPQPAEYADEFIEFVTDNFDCYWLTTHCKGFDITPTYDTTPILEYLSKYFPEDTLRRLEWIKPTSWSVLRTEGIDFDSKFYWIDDYIMLAERMELERLDKTDSFIKADLSEMSLRDIMLRLNRNLINE